MSTVMERLVESRRRDKKLEAEAYEYFFKWLIEVQDSGSGPLLYHYETSVIQHIICSLRSGAVPDINYTLNLVHYLNG